MNHPLTPQQALQIECEQSRRLHDMLAEYDAALRELEANAAAYKIADYNRRFTAIAWLREQTRNAIDRLQQ